MSDSISLAITPTFMLAQQAPGPAVPGASGPAVPGAGGNGTALQPGGNAPPPGGQPTGGAGGGLGFFWIVILFMIVLMLIMSTSGRRQRKEREKMLAAIKRNDRVQTVGGLIGTVVELTDSEMVLRVDETSNTRIRFARSAVQQILREAKGAESIKAEAPAR
jgi:preprotein translocase subunit YajC